MSSNLSTRSASALATVLAVSLGLAAAPATAELIDGLVEYWALDGDYAAGITPEHAGTLQAKGTGLSESGFVPGKFGQGIDLESSDTNNQASVVIGGDENDFDFAGGSMSVSIWYTTESLYRDWQTLVGKGENSIWRLARNGTTPSGLKISLWLIGDGKLNLQDGSWHNAVATIDATGHRLYVDGVLAASNTTPANLQGGTVPMQIGGNPQAADRGWDGIIDDVGIWNRALTEDEVTAIWNGGAGASIASLIGAEDAPFTLTITQDGSDLVFAWESQPGMRYNLMSSLDLEAEFSIWDLVEGEIPATPPTNLMRLARPADPTRFYRVEEYPAPPVIVLAENFDGGDPGWTTGFEATDILMNTAWQLGSPAGGPATGPATAHSGPNCYGTNLSAAYGTESNTWLRTTAIDLSTASGATVTFWQWVDIDDFNDLDRGTVRVLDASLLPGTIAELGVIETNINGFPLGGWTEFSAEFPAAALGKSVALEFGFVSDNDDFFPAAGWYIDDVVVTVPGS